MTQTQGTGCTKQKFCGEEIQSLLTGEEQCHTQYGMKMTMHIDEALLLRVMEANGCKSKTEAVELALREMDRRTRLKAYFKTGLGLDPESWGEAMDPAYDLSAMRAAETAPKHGRRRAS